MKIFNIHQAKTNFSKLIALVSRGEAVIIGKAGQPVAKLVPYADAETPSPKPGMYASQIKMASDFNAESAEINQMFYEKENA